MAPETCFEGDQIRRTGDSLGTGDIYPHDIRSLWQITLAGITVCDLPLAPKLSFLCRQRTMVPFSHLVPGVESMYIHLAPMSALSVILYWAKETRSNLNDVTLSYTGNPNKS